MSPILARVPRTAFRGSRPALQMVKHRYASTATAKVNGSSWGSQWKRVGGTAMMYFPVVGVLMFWPYATTPLMEWYNS